MMDFARRMSRRYHHDKMYFILQGKFKEDRSNRQAAYVDRSMYRD